MRRVGALVAQSSLAFDGSHTVGAICHNDAVAVVAGRLQRAMCVARSGGTRRSRTSCSVVRLKSSRAGPSRRGRRLGEASGSFSIASKMVSAAQWRMAQLLPSTQEGSTQLRSTVQRCCERDPALLISAMTQVSDGPGSHACRRYEHRYFGPASQ